jgi:hypothetical protein
MSAWEKRVRSLSLHSVEQNLALGARYFRFEVLALEGGSDPSSMRLHDAVGVLEEVGTHGRCVIVLPDERRVAVYAVHPEEGIPEVVWYHRTENLPTAGARPN